MLASDSSPAWPFNGDNMNVSFHKQLLLVAVAVLAAGVFSGAQAQIQTTSYNNDHNLNGQPCPQARDQLQDNFTDSYDLSTGLHSGAINYFYDYQTCPSSSGCDFTIIVGQLWSYTVYDVNGGVIASDSLSINPGGITTTWSGRPGASVGRVEYRTWTQQTDSFNDGNGGCPQSSLTYYDDIVCTLGCFTQTTPCPTAAGSSFSAVPGSIFQGESSTLSWSFPNATSVTLTTSAGAVIGTFGSSGSVAVTPLSTTTYIATGNTATCPAVSLQTTVTVTEPPLISSFAAAPASICEGASSTLSWSSSGGTSATVTDLSSGTVTGVPVNGSLVVTPASTRTYRLAVTNGAGTVTQDAVVTVTPLAVINSFSASAGTISAGQSSTLSYNVSSTTTRTITDLTTGTVTGLGPESGTLVVTPASTRTYRLTATNGCNSVSQDIAINVLPVVNTLTASANPVCAGGSTTLSWTSSAATSASITDLLSGVVTPVAVNGAVAVSPGSTRTYRLTVSNASGSATQDIGVTVNPLAVINSYSASANPINAGQSTTLSFSVSNTSGRSITDLSTGTVTSLGSEAGPLVVTPATTRTYRLTGTNGCNSVTQDITITVNQPPTITTFTASANPVCAGASTTLGWTSSSGASATITDLTSGTVTSVAVNGSLAVSPATSRTYRLTVTNGAGSVTSDLPITVTPLAVINSYSASPTTITVGQSSTLSFNVSNTSSRSITDLATGTVTSLGSQSGTLVVTPASTRTYRLTATGSCGSVTQDVPITVNAAGLALIGPGGQPAATGPTSNNDDYTNMTLVSGVAVPFGGVTTSGGARVFTNTVRNPQSSQADTYTLSAPTIPAGFTVEISTNGGASYISLNGGASTTLAVAASADVNVLVRVTAPAGISVLSGYSTVIRATSGLSPGVANDTIDRLWSGYVRADKSVIVSNGTGVGGATDPVPGAILQYVITYTNVTPVATGSGNVNMTATNVQLVEDGGAAPNNWAATTTHVAGSASDTRGGTITGDLAGSSLLTDTVPSLPPAQSGVFRFSRRIR